MLESYNLLCSPVEGEQQVVSVSCTKAAEPALRERNIIRILRKKRKSLREDRMRFLLSRLQRAAAWRHLLIAILLAVCLALLFPGVSEAHAILLRSDPA